MDFQDFTQQHIQTLKSRLAAAGITISRKVGITYLENHCKVRGISIEIEAPSVLIRIEGGCMDYKAVSEVNVTWIDLDCNESKKAAAAFEQMWEAFGDCIGNCYCMTQTDDDESDLPTREELEKGASILKKLEGN